jgi:spore germination cell wall hydrolase CwlJ-like protein
MIKSTVAISALVVMLLILMVSVEPTATIATPTATYEATPTIKPTAKPTPTVKPTPKPTPKPTAKPTPKPTAKPIQKTEKPAPTKSTAREYISSDLNLLAAIVHQEARGCSDEIQLLVANVVINRVNDPRFPNTIRGVIYQKGQYSGAGSLGSVSPNADCIRNAKRVLAGERFCPAKVVWQAEFRQGKHVWKRVGNQYFCY